jgi:hypothetical protein
MSQQCPRCALFNPPSALRCDCGYDFRSGTVERSYLAAHVVEKHGQAKIAQDSARRKILSGISLLVLAGILSAGASLASGRVRIAAPFSLGGALLLVGGLRERRRRLPDPATVKDGIRRS